MHLRLISWFFIILNFMEYIGSQNASRGRRQRRSKCGVFSAFARSLPPPSPVGSPGRCGAGTRRGGPPALRPTPPTEVTVQAPGETASLTPSSPHPPRDPQTRASRSRASRGPRALPPPGTSGSRRSRVFPLTSSRNSRFPFETRTRTPNPRDPPAPGGDARGGARSPWRPVPSRRRPAWGDLAGLSRGDRLRRARGAAGGEGADVCAATGPRHTRVEPEAGEARRVRVSARFGAARSPSPRAVGTPAPPCRAGFQVQPGLSHVNISGSFKPVPFLAGRQVQGWGAP